MIIAKKGSANRFNCFTVCPHPSLSTDVQFSMGSYKIYEKNLEFVFCPLLAHTSVIPSYNSFCVFPTREGRAVSCDSCVTGRFHSNLLDASEPSGGSEKDCTYGPSRLGGRGEGRD